jgi:galactokinase
MLPRFTDQTHHAPSAFAHLTTSTLPSPPQLLTSHRFTSNIQNEPTDPSTTPAQTSTHPFYICHVPQCPNLSQLPFHFSPRPSQQSRKTTPPPPINLDPFRPQAYPRPAMDVSIPSLTDAFAQIFGATDHLHVVRAPGRVNLIGEHTDYNDGFVFPMAIEPEVRMVCRGRDDGKCRFASTVFPGQIAEFSLDKKIERADPTWANYCRGVAAELEMAGIPLTGVDALIANTLPPGGGLSSSAAIEVATACCFLAEGGLDIDMTRLALICQKAEHEYALVPCGIMDQTAVISSKAGHAMLLDCRDLSKQFVALDPAELRVVIVNTMVHHELSAGAYAERRKQCEAGVAFFKRDHPNVRALRDVTLKQVDDSRGDLDPVVFRRCRHVVSETARAQEAAKHLGKKEYERAGELMVQSHNSLRDDYEVSCPELDLLAAEAMKVKGVYGARMTGGGFGGCIVALVQPRAVDGILDHLKKTYQERFHKDPVGFVTTATAGASILQ